MSIRVLIAGGGTSGHVNPALAIAEAIRRRDPDAAIEFCGTRNRERYRAA
jgi:UDP-N-acetylglucosamine--N-acetylmuramyl-(pentapeptide) pyrophosphoryl-undecaprenol N-acetylglucosamine transferase